MGGKRSGRKVPKTGAGRKLGRKKDGRGRCVSQQKDHGETPYSELSADDKLLYHRKAACVSKGYLPTEAAAEAPSPSDQEASSIVLPEVRGRGRPPKDFEIGAMDPDTLRERKRQLGREQYRRDQISIVRRQAVLQRRDREGIAAVQDVSDLEENAESEESDDERVELHPKTVTLKKSEFLTMLPINTEIQYALLRKLLQLYDINHINFVQREAEVDAAGDRIHLHRYRLRICDFLERQKLDAAVFLLHWSQKLMSQDEAAFCKAGFTFTNPADIPAHLRIQRISNEVTAKLLTTRTDPDTRKFSIKQALEVAKQAGLQLRKGDITALMRGIGCSRIFAVKVLRAVDSSESDAASIFKRRIRRDSIQVTDIPGRLLEFLSNPEHSRALPGHETVSVAYGVRKPKFLLKKSKLELLEIFKKENPEVNFSSRVLLREWPAHFVPPSHKDQERNVCPLHSNFRRCLDGLRKAGAAQNLPRSVRGICATTMCQSPTADPLDPATWPDKCALGQCASCPELVVDLPPNHNMVAHFLQWKKGETSKVDRDGNPKVAFSLFPVSVQVKEAVKLLDSFFPKMKEHVFVATHQYQALKLRTESLNIGDLLTI